MISLPFKDMHISTAGVATLAALACGDLLQQAIASPATATPDRSPAEIVTPNLRHLKTSATSRVHLLTSTAPPEVISGAESLTHLGSPSDSHEDANPSADVPADEFVSESASSSLPLIVNPEPVEAPVVPLEKNNTGRSDNKSSPVVPPPEVRVSPLAHTLAIAAPETLARPEQSLSTASLSASEFVPPPITTAEALLHPEQFMSATNANLPLANSPISQNHQNFGADRAATPGTQNPSLNEIQNLQRRLEQLSTQPDSQDEYAGSPALTLSNPSGFGADHFRGFLGVGFQATKRGVPGADGLVTVGLGVGDARRAVGVQISYTIANLGIQRDRAPGSGGFNVKLHHQFPNGLSVAAGWEGFAIVGGPVDFKNTIYGAVTQIIRTRSNIQTPLSRVALTVGVGSGRFRSEADFDNKVNSVNVFGSAAVRIVEPVSAVVEWTGQDLAIGMSIVPFKNIPFVITPAVRDLVGVETGPRFVLGAGISFQF